MRVGPGRSRPHGRLGRLQGDIRFGRCLDLGFGRPAGSLDGFERCDIHFQRCIIGLEPSSDLLQGIPWESELGEALRARILSIDLQRQHPMGDAVAKGEATTRHERTHPETGLARSGGIRGAGLIHAWV